METPSRDGILELAAGYAPACVVGAAAELDLWTLLAGGPLTAEEIAQRIGGDRRGITMLLDAVTALGLLHKRGDDYAVPEPLLDWLVEGAEQSVLPMLLHRMNVLRGWAQLAWTAKAGMPAPRSTSIRGAAADRRAFIGAMHVVNIGAADELVARLGPPKFKHLLDVGGASGTWTLAFLRAVPEASATIFDLPDAIAQAGERILPLPEGPRIELAAGDFYADPLPSGADYAWVSAIVHQHSREHNRQLFAKVHDALVPGGRIAIRDIVMEADRTRPLDGALFAINMLVNTESGGTFTFEELAADLTAAGFVEPELRIADASMSSVVEARRPSSQ